MLPHQKDIKLFTLPETKSLEKPKFAFISTAWRKPHKRCETHEIHVIWSVYECKISIQKNIPSAERFLLRTGLSRGTQPLLSCIMFIIFIESNYTWWIYPYSQTTALGSGGGTAAIYCKAVATSTTFYFSFFFVALTLSNPWLLLSSTTLKASFWISL